MFSVSSAYFNYYSLPIPSSTHRTAQLKGNFEEVQRFPFGRLNTTDMEVLGPLQQRLLSQPILDVSRPNRQYTFDKRAGGKQVLCVLLQVELEGPSRPVCYCSRSVNMAKQAWTQHKRVCRCSVGRFFILGQISMACNLLF